MPVFVGQRVERPYRKIATRFWDSHLHGRNAEDGMLIAVAKDVQVRSCGGILMCNTKPLLLTCADVQKYLFTEWRPHLTNEKLVPTIYLTQHTDPEHILLACKFVIIARMKWYPPGHQQSTNSVTPEMLMPREGKVGKLLAMMEREGIPLLLHGEVAYWDHEELPQEDREAFFIKNILPSIRSTFNKLRISLEHISTLEAAEYMEEHGHPYYLVCTITAHHLALDSRDLYQGGFLRGVLHCLPIVKHLRNKYALHKLLMGKYDFVLAGTDLAPHDMERKTAYCCGGGLYTGHCSVELYLEVLEMLGLLEYADAFFYGNAKLFHMDLVPDNPEMVEFETKDWQVESTVPYAEGHTFSPFGYFPAPADRWTFTWAVAA